MRAVRVKVVSSLPVFNPGFRRARHNQNWSHASNEERKKGGRYGGGGGGPQWTADAGLRQHPARQSRTLGGPGRWGGFSPPPPHIPRNGPRPKSRSRSPSTSPAETPATSSPARLAFSAPTATAHRSGVLSIHTKKASGAGSRREAVFGTVLERLSPVHRADLPYVRRFDSGTRIGQHRDTIGPPRGKDFHI